MSDYFRLRAAEMAPDNLRPFLVGLKMADEKEWRCVAADGSTIRDHRAAYDRGEVELTQGRAEDGHALLYSIPRRQRVMRHPGATLGASDVELSPQAKVILATLKGAATAGRLCPTNDELRELIRSASNSTVHKAMDALEAAGIISVERIGKGRVVTIIETGNRTARHPRWGITSRDGVAE